jgi:hypothetical protein
MTIKASITANMQEQKNEVQGSAKCGFFRMLWASIQKQISQNVHNL